MLGTASLVSVTSSLLVSFSTFWFKVVISFAVFQSVVFDRTIPFLKSKPESMNTEKRFA
jgi:hypothetical protein